MTSYQTALKSLLFPPERQLFASLSSPKKIQDFLDTVKIKFEPKGNILIHSPYSVLKRRRANCIEGALFAAASLAYHGREPLLMDFQTTPDDEDHVVALFKEKAWWGAISKTNHPVLRWRDPIYKTPRELAMSYFHEYYLTKGKQARKKTMRAFSAPFSLKRYAPRRWVTTNEDLDWLAVELDESKHFAAVPQGALLRPAYKIEVEAFKLIEWKRGHRG